MRYLTFVSAALMLAVGAFGVDPERWTIASTEELLKGESEGFTISSDGSLRPGSRLEKIADVPDTFVLSQASDERGTLFIGTGGSGNVYRVEDGEVELLFTASEPQIYSIAIDSGTLWVGSSPSGKLYRVDPDSGEHEIWFEPEEAYIWDIATGNGSIFLATGVEGRLYEVTGRGEGTVLFDSTENHIRTVLRDGEKIIAGGSGKGRIYELDPKAGARAIYDSSYSEISALSTGGEDTFWAAGVTGTLPSTPPRETRDSSKTQSSEQSGNTPTVEVSFSFDGPSASSPSAGSSELYRIESDGFVETVWRLDREIIYDITPDEDGGVVVATGPKGRIYRVDPQGRVSLIGSVPEKQIVTVDRSSNGYVATTTNSGSIYSLEATGSGRVSFTSAVKDSGRLSRFGEYELRGRSIPDDIVAEFRTGNTDSPDVTWSDWVTTRGTSGVSGAPTARYVQWRVSHESAPRMMRIDSLTLAWVNRNVAPSVEAFAVDEPAVVYLSGGYPTAPGVVEATNPDQYGIFTSISEPTSTEGGKKYFRKGFRTVTWKTSDPNGDDLRHDLWFRPREMETWFRLRENAGDKAMNFDTTQLPDGEYELKLVVSDAPSNEVGALEVSREDLWFTVDNTAPAISMERRRGDLFVTVRDSSSAIGKVEISIDAEEWKRLQPEDGISDSSEERYRLDADEIDGRLVIIRAIDGFFNVATARVE